MCNGTLCLERFLPPVGPLDQQASTYPPVLARFLQEDGLSFPKRPRKSRIWIFGVVQNDPESIDPSLIYKMNLDFWGCYEEKKSQFYNQTNRIIIVPSP